MTCTVCFPPSVKSMIGAFALSRRRAGIRERVEAYDIDEEDEDAEVGSEDVGVRTDEAEDVESEVDGPLLDSSSSVAEDEEPGFVV